MTFGTLVSYADVSFAVHNDMRSHTGGATTFGKGIVMPKSTKQTLNTRSTTESEIVGTSDYLPDTVWLLRFLEHQGYKIKRKVLMQDNASALKIEKNGRRSESRRTRHMDIRYFWVKDRLDADGIEIDYCPTEIKLGDYFTKPLQGALFNKLRNVIMGHTSVKALVTENDINSATEERVGIMQSLGSAGGSRTNVGEGAADNNVRPTYAKALLRGVEGSNGHR